MNKFVNYGKRSITLPEGCKDLIDVLRLDKPASGPDRAEPGSLVDVEAHIARQLQAAAKVSFLLILLQVSLLTIDTPGACGYSFHMPSKLRIGYREARCQITDRGGQNEPAQAPLQLRRSYRCVNSEE